MDQPGSVLIIMLVLLSALLSLCLGRLDDDHGSACGRYEVNRTVNADFHNVTGQVGSAVCVGAPYWARPELEVDSERR